MACRKALSGWRRLRPPFAPTTGETPWAECWSAALTKQDNPRPARAWPTMRLASSAWHATAKHECSLSTTRRVASAARSCTPGMGQHSTLAHRYDPLGNRIATTLPDGRTIHTLTYGSGHVHQIHIDGEVICDFERDALHREVERTQGQLASRFQLDPLGRLLASHAQVRAGQEAPRQVKDGRARVRSTRLMVRTSPDATAMTVPANCETSTTAARG
jgi:YD repeat-containing protein